MTKAAYLLIFRAYTKLAFLCYQEYIYNTKSYKENYKEEQNVSPLSHL